MRKSNFRFGKKTRTMLQLIVLILSIFILWSLPKISSRFTIYMISRIMYMGLMTMSLNLIMGFGGLTSLSQAGFAGIAGYAFAIYRVSMKGSYGAAVLIGLFVVMTAGLLFGGLSVRTSSIVFMMMSIALANLVHLSSLQLTDITRGFNGIIGIKGPTINGKTYSGTGNTFYIIAFIVPISYFFLKRLVKSPFGIAIQGMRDNKTKMSSLGFNVNVIRIVLVVISSLFAGIAGILQANFFATMAPDYVKTEYSLMCLFMCIIGGAEYLEGGLLGAAIYLMLSNFISRYTRFDDAIIGGLFIIAVFLIPNGILGEIYKLYNNLFRKRKMVSLESGMRGDVHE
ncbi:MAG: branched-chain amino acid ABC transporter permease [Christensenellaceae bacterium]|nr:branched-chain amino acid ABC transporter permease [Christensenellaceae bacterium]